MPNFTLPDTVFTAAAARFPTPFHLYDEDGIRKNVRALQSAFSWMPDYREYFAVKALPTPEILRIFRQEGCGLDCASRCELMLAKRCGFEGEDIMFSANSMPPDEFDLARGMGAMLNLDDISDIDLLPGHGGVPDCVCVRFNPGGTFGAGNAIMGAPGDSKYGWTREQLSVGVKKLKQMGVKRFGLHAFLASNTTDNAYYPALAKLLFGVGREVEAECGLPLAFVNLSGGIGIPYKPSESTADIAQIGRDVEAAYRAVFGAPQKGKPGIKTELGRFMTGPFGWLLTRAVHEKHIYKNYIGVDACAVNLMRPAMYGAYHHISVAGKRDVPCSQTYDVTGSLCENNDKFAVDRALPPIEKGDLLIIHDTGAHGASMGYQYNGRLRSAEVLYTQDGDFKLIRRAETPEDYFRTVEGF